MSVSMKLKQLEALKIEQRVVHSEIKSVSVEEEYFCKKNYLMSFFSNILHPDNPNIKKSKEP